MFVLLKRRMSASDKYTINATEDKIESKRPKCFIRSRALQSYHSSILLLRKSKCKWKMDSETIPKDERDKQMKR